MNLDSTYWSGRSVFVTGHTGFKGGWLVVWLHEAGAIVHGYALNPPTSPSLFEIADIRSLLASDVRADVANLDALRVAMSDARAETVFHLAAQPLVRESYRIPISTLTTNVMGTANLLEAARSVKSIRSVVVVTSDKVYENVRPDHANREGDPLGGRDLYSASKAAAELVVASFRSSFFADQQSDAQVATARAGNVIGGGDWARDRLVPDCLRAFDREEPVQIRSPHSIRPWQHVLEPVSGYLNLAQRLAQPNGNSFAASWNFGPHRRDHVPVLEIAQRVAAQWGESAHVEVDSSSKHPPEDGVLMLDARRAHDRLDWRPRWSLDRAIQYTVDWHRAWRRGAQMLDVTRDQILDYASVA